MHQSRAYPPRDFKTREKFPRDMILTAVREFLRGREDAVVFSGHAVNAYAKEQRATQEMDLLSTRAAKLATELRDYLNRRFRLFLLIRRLNKGEGRRIYQATQSGNHVLIDLRPVSELPAARRISQVLFMEPAELIASKVIAYHQRRDKPKAKIDRCDLTKLLLAFPEFKREAGPVTERLQAAGVDQAVFEVWKELVAQELK
ncbi:MAG: hypothetical protein ONB46_08375 [candidate division KSB1 bacterium]|nr:hypothetical protein [candidate division KSB1 bacterium]MDZ7365715.1 hypothetical protein [candidate division KSB1 bacterium]MDZ7403805.1 hypothetical protein [candidate division KSB1 bacterium]